MAGRPRVPTISFVFENVQVCSQFYMETLLIYESRSIKFATQKNLYHPYSRQRDVISIETMSIKCNSLHTKFGWGAGREAGPTERKRGREGVRESERARERESKRERKRAREKDRV